MTEHPNVLCISIDSLRADYVSFFGSAAETTPFMDEWSETATVFTETISPSIWTLPVHASVFSGLYPSEHQLIDTTKELGDHPTFAEVLREAGYETAAFYGNRWLDVGGISRGFGADSTEPPSDTLSPIGTALERVSPGLKDTVSTWYFSLKNAARSHRIHDLYEHARAGRFPERSDDERRVSSLVDRIHGADQPFCYFFHTNAVHSPYTPPSPFHREFTDRSSLGLFLNRSHYQRRIYENQEQSWVGNLSPPEKEVETIRDLDPSTLLYAHFGPAETDDRLAEYERVLGAWVDEVRAAREDPGDDEAVVERFAEGTEMGDVWGDRKARDETAMNVRGVLGYLDG